MDVGNVHICPALVPRPFFSNMSTHSNNNKHDSEEAIQSDYSIRTENTTKRKSTCQVFACDKDDKDEAREKSDIHT